MIRAKELRIEDVVFRLDVFGPEGNRKVQLEMDKDYDDKVDCLMTSEQMDTLGKALIVFAKDW